MITSLLLLLPLLLLFLLALLLELLTLGLSLLLREGQRWGVLRSFPASGPFDDRVEFIFAKIDLADSLLDHFSHEPVEILPKPINLVWVCAAPQLSV